ncbi:MAG: hypothetical protein ACKO96_30260, partial [Flammeovirgaceae bacterium]
MEVKWLLAQAINSYVSGKYLMNMKMEYPKIYVEKLLIISDRNRRDFFTHNILSIIKSPARVIQ